MTFFQIQEAKTVNTSTGPTQVQTLTLKDETSEIKLNLWREKANQELQAGTYVQVTNGQASYNPFFKEQQINTQADTTITVSILNYTHKNTVNPLIFAAI